MTDVKFRKEAQRCRVQAAEFAGRPEQEFLLRVANTFDELAAGTGVVGQSARTSAPDPGAAEAIS